MVKPHLGLTEIIGGGAIALMMSLPANAAATQITGVQVNQTAGGAEIFLQTGNGDRPQVFTVNRGNALVADIVNAQLALPEGNGFLQNSPAPGISAIMVSQLDANSVRLTVMGETAPPASQVAQTDTSITFNINASGAVAQIPPGNPPLPSNPAAPPLLPNVPPSQVLVPNPQVNINGVPSTPSSAPGLTPPLLPRAVAPPVGDIAVATTDASPTVIELGTSEVVPRLVLRDAPVRDVLSLLARAAGLNIAYLDQQPSEGGDPAAAQETSTAANSRISLDIENEPVQNVFNYVLRISGLEANLNGRTIFVGSQLPNSARSLVMRTLRLNQVDVSTALNFLVGLGAETAVSRERQVATAVAVPVTGGELGATSGINQVSTTTEIAIETQRVDYQDSTPILRGLSVVGDERTRSVTLVGTPKLLEIASAQLTQLDIRRRQVAINVRVIDVNLSNIDRASTSFSFGIDDARIIQDDGIGVINFGSSRDLNNNNTTGISTSSPIGVGTAVDQLGNLITGGNLQGSNFNFVRNFLAQLRFAVTSGNAKILTDPTLVIQEGETAEVQLTQDVVTNFEIETEGTGNERTQTVTVETTPAGLILSVDVEGIDDNGFVTLSVGPTISAPAGTFTADVQDSQLDITLLAVRRLSSGRIRVRDGQTLILSGIIQDQDRTDVTKVPILGDIPILGALFRSTTRSNTRQEVIVMLTPQIIDDSDTSTFGYRYVPSREVQNILEQGRR